MEFGMMEAAPSPAPVMIKPDLLLQAFFRAAQWLWPCQRALTIQQNVCKRSFAKVAGSSQARR
jgi:hypothetical protein